MFVCLLVCLKRAPLLPLERWWAWKRGRQTTNQLEPILVTIATKASTPPERMPWQVRFRISVFLFLAIGTLNLHFVFFCIPGSVLRKNSRHCHWQYDETCYEFSLVWLFCSKFTHRDVRFLWIQCNLCAVNITCCVQKTAPACVLAWSTVTMNNPPL